MGHRAIATQELASLLGVLAHPARVRLVLELRAGERDVGSLREALGLAPSAVSQHLAQLRAHRLVIERREGRHVFYHLCDARTAPWLLEGLRLVEGELAEAERIRSSVVEARALWAKRPRGGRA